MKLIIIADTENTKRDRIRMKTKLDFKNPVSLKLSIHINYVNKLACLLIRKDS